MNTAFLMEKVAEVAPDIHQFLLQTSEEIKQSPFKKDIVDEMDEVIKTAAFADWGLKNPQQIAGAAAGMVLAGVATNLAGDLYDAARRGITKSRNYKNMLEENPDLSRHSAKKVQKVFSTLHTFNPEFASDPTVAGSFVRNQLNMGLEGVDPSQLKTLVDARKAILQSRSDPFGNLDLTTKPPSEPKKGKGRP